MNIEQNTRIYPNEFPELASLLWNQDISCSIKAKDAFEIYERNWRHIDRTKITTKEIDFIKALTDLFGNGVFPDDGFFLNGLSDAGLG